jgi:hypothetical protein
VCTVCAHYTFGIIIFFLHFIALGRRRNLGAIFFLVIKVVAVSASLVNVVRFDVFGACKSVYTGLAVSLAIARLVVVVIDIVPGAIVIAFIDSALN